MGVIDSVSRIACAASVLAILLAGCGGSDPSPGQQDITFGLAFDVHPPAAQGGQSSAGVRVVDRDPVEVEVPPDEREPFDAAVSLRMVAPMPPGVSADFAPATIRAGETASMVVSASAAAQPGRHQLVVAGTLAGGSTTTEYGAHEVIVTGTCAPGTEFITELFPSRAGRTIGLTRNGTVYLWGRNTVPEITDVGFPPVPRALDFYTPQRIDDVSPALWAASGPTTSAIVRTDGTVHVIGIHYRSQVRAPLDRIGWEVQPVPNLSGFVQVVAQDNATFFALHGGGTVWRFTAVFSHESGLRVSEGTPVAGVLDATSLAAGSQHLLVLRRDGSVLAMGFNDHGQLGTGDKQRATALQPVPGLFDITRIAAGDDHSLAIRTDTTLLAWGRGDSGQIGNGRRDDALRPVQVESANRNPLVFVQDIAAGASHSLLVLSDGGTVMSWGRGIEGQLGHGATEALNPVAVSGPLSNRVYAAANHSLVTVMTAGTVRGWGDNERGQLGDGTGSQRLAPVDALGLGHSEQTCGGGGPSAPGAAQISVTVQGPGQVNGSGFSCREGGSGEACVRSFNLNSVITLQALPDTDARFLGWSGCSSSEALSITLTVDRAALCAARFGP